MKIEGCLWETYCNAALHPLGRHYLCVLQGPAVRAACRASAELS